MKPLFQRVLIANRGEIALRIARTCRALGISPAMSYSRAERGHPHTRAGETAVELPGNEPLAGYLDENALLDAAKKSGADAIHPGYGFLSESASFAAKVEKAGLTWIGPSPETIKLLGDKDSARRLAKESGVPVLSGYDCGDEPPEKISAAAKDLGFPLLVKAVAGGGGRGMRLVRAATELGAALESAKREAIQGFGNGRLFLERYLEGARHVEVQLFGDKHGNVFHLFERDCTLQRRNQKVVEIAPAPSLSPAVRDRLLTEAVKLARAAKLSNATTAEFLVSPSGEFFFLEANCRLQVEHPVTEAVLGVDLVELQLRAAADGSLSAIASEMLEGRRKCTGFAVETRIYAEAPARGFVPSEGRLVHVDLPRDPSVRVEAALEEGMIVSTSFDPMLAKIITAGDTIAAALAKNGAALADTVLAGVETNIAFVREVLTRPEIASGAMTTKSLEEWAKKPAPDCEKIAARALAISLALPFGDPVPAAPVDPFSVNDGFRGTFAPGTGETLLGSPLLSYRVQGECSAELKAQRLSVIAGPESTLCEVQIGTRKVSLRISRSKSGRALVEIGKRTFEVWQREISDTESVLVLDSRSFRIFREHLRGAEESGADHGPAIVSPLPGKLIRYLVAAGDSVAAGQAVAVIESMKMEHVVEAGSPSIVAELCVEAGSPVKAGDQLVMLK